MKDCLAEPPVMGSCQELPIINLISYVLNIFDYTQSVIRNEVYTIQETDMLCLVYVRGATDKTVLLPILKQALRP